ncbi:DUF4097 family beta strand repeat-containing protein [Metabacillus halosaccharovorans]|uniref:DUF4097 family beta strand repeat-containing protein n=1 Tax=Metabacillus halosaccharovorans TaxID=930124 RepID=UPI00203B3D65|nr:DUF4097 family beta strand repeat-containing protein [Metabacillus halosaccharovorans]MCM3439276.1 DUF4097 domain-containing protein [Metabacillus halosaccharovorans]
MKQKKIALAMILIGILLAVIGLFSGTKFSIILTDNGLKAVGKEDRQNGEWVLEEFNNFEIDLTDAKLEVIPSDEYKLEIESLEGTKITHTVQDKTLTIKDGTSHSGFTFAMNFIGNIQKTMIKIYVPADKKFDNVSIANDFGDIMLDGMKTDKLTILSNDGDVDIKEIQAKDLAIQNNFGDTNASNVKTNKLTIEINDGDAELNTFDISQEADLTNDFGEISLRDFTSHGTKIESSDGEIYINGELLGKTNIESSFSDMMLELTNKETELNYHIKNDFGDIVVNGEEFETKASNNVDTDDKITILSNDGDVEITLDK